MANIISAVTREGPSSLQFGAMVEFVTSESIEVFTQRMALVGIADPAFWTRFGVHYGLFLGALRSGATQNQMSA